MTAGYLGELRDKRMVYGAESSWYGVARWAEPGGGSSWGGD